MPENAALPITDVNPETQSRSIAQVPVPPSDPSSIMGLIHSAAAAGETNTKDWKEAERYGITDESLQQRHPELVKESQDLQRTVDSSITKARWTMGLSTAAGAAIPLALKKPKNLWARAAVTLVTAFVGAASGVAASLALFSKPVARKVLEASEMENKALEQDIGNAVVSGVVPAPASKDFTLTVAPREGSHAAQIKIEASQPTPTGIKQ